MSIKLLNNTPVERVIETVMTIANEMIDASAHGQYDILLKLEAERLACLAWLFDADTDASPRCQSATVDGQQRALERLLSSNDALVAVSVKHRDQLANQCADINKAQQVAKAYAG